MKYLELFFHALWWTVLIQGLFGRQMSVQSKHKYSNKPTKGYKRIIKRFLEDLATLVVTDRIRTIFVFGCTESAVNQSLEHGFFFIFLPYFDIIIFFFHLAQTGLLTCLMKTLGSKHTIMVGLLFEMLQLMWYGFGSQTWMMWAAGILAAISR